MLAINIIPTVEVRTSATYSARNRLFSSRSTEARMMTAAIPTNRKLKNKEKSSTTISPSNAFPRSSATISTSDHSADTASPASPRATLATRLVPPRIGSVTSPTTISPAAISSASSGPNRLMSSINQGLRTRHPALDDSLP